MTRARRTSLLILLFYVAQVASVSVHPHSRWIDSGKQDPYFTDQVESEEEIFANNVFDQVAPSVVAESTTITTGGPTEIMDPPTEVTPDATTATTLSMPDPYRTSTQDHQFPETTPSPGLELQIPYSYNQSSSTPAPQENEQHEQATNETLPASEDKDFNDMVGLMHEGMGIIIDGTDDNETISGSNATSKSSEHTETGVSNATKSGDPIKRTGFIGGEQENPHEDTGHHVHSQKKGSAEKEPIKCSDNGRPKNRFHNVNCDYVDSYYVVQHHARESESWVVMFSMTESLHHAIASDHAPSHFVVRSQRTDQAHPKEHGEIRYLVVPWNESKESITIDTLEAGDYEFQICAITPPFTPGLLDSDHFSWRKHAPAYHVHLEPSPKEARAHKKRDFITADGNLYKPEGLNYFSSNSDGDGDESQQGNGIEEHDVISLISGAELEK